MKKLLLTKKNKDEGFDGLSNKSSKYLLLKPDNRYQVSLHLYAGLEKELPGCCFRGFCGHVNSKCDMQVYNGFQILFEG